MHSDKNLVKIKKLSKEEATRRGRIGGLASVEARKRKKTLNELANIMINSKIGEKEKKRVKEISSELSDDDMTNKASMVASLIQQANNGDTKAYQILADIEESNNKKERAKEWFIPVKDVTKDFIDLYRVMHDSFKNGKYREIISKGGRGSIKSNFWTLAGVETIKNYPESHVVYTRRYKVDLRGSVYNQFLKTVTRLGMLDEWEFTTSPMIAKYKATGQMVIFVGCDKPISLKSYNLPFGHVMLLVNEECDEMAGIEQLDNVEDTFLRQDVNALSVKVFNPPKSANNFMNEYALTPKPKTYVNHSYYYNVPVEWLGQRFFERAEWFKVNKPLYYANNYLGEVTGTGGAIFDNVEFRKITDEEIKNQNYLNHGLDFGFIHPQAFIESAYDLEEETLLVTYELVKVKMKQETFAKKLSKFMNVEIIADSANPDKISDWIDYGFDVIGATKRWSGGGRDFAWEWLQTRRKIIVDPERTPHIAHELRKAEHEILKDGTFSSKYPVLNEDCIMALIYGNNRHIMAEKSLQSYSNEEEREVEYE